MKCPTRNTLFGAARCLALKRAMVMATVVFFWTSGNGAASAVQGPGATSCAEFAKMYQDDPSVEGFFYSWAQGFWSSLNLVAKGLQRPTHELEKGDANNSALRAFCANNPLKNYMDGVTELYGKLPVISP